MKTIEFNGRTFWQDAEQLYYRAWNRERMRPDYLHRCVWEAAHGAIPEGFHIHHKDENRENNDLSNLEALSPKDHAQEHYDSASAERREAIRLNLEVAARPAASAWHRSDEGRAWHAQMAKAALAERVHALNCDQCDKPILRVGVIQKGRFCSAGCKSANRRASGVDDEQRSCVYCAETFTKNRYAKAETCSRACTNRQRALLKRR